jgi:hypothetical protein
VHPVFFPVKVRSREPKEKSRQAQGLAAFSERSGYQAVSP